MATAILNGVLKSGILAPESIVISDIDTSKLAVFKEKGVNVTSNNNEVYSSEYIFFAVKPQIFRTLKDEIGTISGDKHIISIMAGIDSDTLLEYAGKDIPLCRVMPNTPCMIGYGMSVLYFKGYNDDEKSFVNSIFASLGEIAEKDESFFDAVTSVSGSGPAYVYMFIDGMIKGGIEGGLTEQEARQLAVQTVIGAANMVKSNPDKPIYELTDAVCSKGGTTIEAVNSFRNDGLTEIIVKGVKACRNRSKELSGK